MRKEWKGALKAIFVVAVLCVGIGIAVAAWDDTKTTGDALTAAEWNAMTADQKTRFKTDGSVAMTGDFDGGSQNISTSGDITGAMVTSFASGTVGDHWLGITTVDDVNFGNFWFYRTPGAYVYPLRIGTNLTDLAVGTPTGAARMNILQIENMLIIPNHTPSSASENCTVGRICYDLNYTYVCTATNTWKRAALSSW